jgi:hypothetical protein
MDCNLHVYCYVFVKVGTAKGWRMDGRGSIHDKVRNYILRNVYVGSEVHAASYTVVSGAPSL